MKKQIPYFTAWKSIPGRFFVLGLWVLFLSCEQTKDIVDQPLYDGPISSLDSSRSIVSDSGIIVMKMRSVRQNNFENGDQEWPDGLLVEWFNKRGDRTAFFSADYVYYTKGEDLYKAEGSVVVKNLREGDELKSEELFWNRKEETFHTDKFVTIRSDGEVHTGEGMESNQDFTEYQILKPSGSFRMEDDPNRPQPRTIPLEEPVKQKPEKK